VVFDNQPPWVDRAAVIESFDMQHTGLMKLWWGRVSKRMPKVTVKSMDYADIDDPAWLAPVFDVNFTHRDGTKYGQLSLRQLYGTVGERAQMLSNFFAMTSFLKECMLPEHNDVDLCVYLDPDMLMYKNSTGILELATASFEENPALVVVSPPYGCFQQKWWQKKGPTGACPSKQAIVSSRHVIANRGRLVSSMPMHVQLGDIGNQYWEVTMTEALGHTGRGQILCGQDFFIVHPPSRFQQNMNNTMSLRGLLKEMLPQTARCSESNACSPEVEASLGTRELVRRFEAGMMTADRESMYNKGCGCCSDMMPSTQRVRSGEAFFQPREALESESFKSAANDAAFEWVVKCTQ